MQVPRRNANAVKECLLTSAAKQAFKSTASHTYLCYMQENVTQSIVYVNIELAAIISLNIHEIFLSVIHEETKPFLITQKQLFY